MTKYIIFHVGAQDSHLQGNLYVKDFWLSMCKR